MKGSELIRLWERAKRVFDEGTRDAFRCEEIGGCLRGAYDVTWDGCSVCTFMERHLDVVYSADCIGNGWTLRPSVLTTHDRRHNRGFATEIKDIDPDFDYEVDEIKSPAEKLEAGELKCRGFSAWVMMPDKVGEKHVFDCFDKADAFARSLAKEKADDILRRERGNRYVRTAISDSAQKARELGVLRFYPYYVYSGRYTNAVVVDAEY